MPDTLIEIPENATPGERLIMQSLNIFYCHLKKELDGKVTKLECEKAQQALKKGLDDRKQTSFSNWVAVVALIISVIGLLLSAVL